MKNKNQKLRSKISLLILLLSFVFQFSLAQSLRSDCGTWEIDTIIETPFVNIDTVNYDSNGDSTWTVDTWEEIFSPQTTLLYCPCGCGYTTKEYRNRINGKGIIQQANRLTTHKYVPRPETPYEKRVGELKNRR